MEEIKIFLERVIGMTGLSGDYVPVVRYALLVVIAFLLAWLAGWLLRGVHVLAEGTDGHRLRARYQRGDGVYLCEGA